jgi:hypothetical protein
MKEGIFECRKEGKREGVRKGGRVEGGRLK